jgi:hypothetical protein
VRPLQHPRPASRLLSQEGGVQAGESAQAAGSRDARRQKIRFPGAAPSSPLDDKTEEHPLIAFERDSANVIAVPDDLARSDGEDQHFENQSDHRW